MWECGAGSELAALLYPRGRDGHCYASLLPKAQLQDPAAAFLHPTHLLTLRLLLFLLFFFLLFFLLLFLPAQLAVPYLSLPAFLSAICYMQVGDCRQPRQDLLKQRERVAQGYKKVICYI